MSQDSNGNESARWSVGIGKTIVPKTERVGFICDATPREKEPRQSSTTTHYPHLWASSMMRYRHPILLRAVFSMLATSYVVRSTSQSRSSSGTPGFRPSRMMAARSS